MANRRMISIKIIDSARFIKMPSSTQSLYFHLITRADDDGVVEAFSVMRLVGATEDDLKILNAKGFITVLNEDLVTYINDWLEHNKIRADRKIDSMYKDLLIKVVPTVDIIQKRPRADRQLTDHGTSHGQPKDGIGKVRLGKDRLGKVNKKDSSSNKKVATFSEESFEMLAVNTLIHQIRDINPNFKEPNRQSWCTHIDKMKRLDNRSEENIKKVIMFATTDSFWQNNILSTKKLRDKFDTLYMQMNKRPVEKQSFGEYVEEMKAW